MIARSRTASADRIERRSLTAVLLRSRAWRLRGHARTASPSCSNCAERDDPVASECARHACAVVIHMLDRDRPPSHLGQIACDDPRRPLRSVQQRADRHLGRLSSRASGMRIVTVAPQRRRPACLAARSALRTCAFAHPVSESWRSVAGTRKPGLPNNSACATEPDRGAQGFRQLDHGFPAAGVRGRTTGWPALTAAEPAACPSRRRRRPRRVPHSRSHCARRRHRPRRRSAGLSRHRPLP